MQAARTITRAHVTIALALFTWCGAACSGTKADTGNDGDMRVEGAQFFRGAMPADTRGPLVASVDLQTNLVRAGQIEKPCSGALAPGATAAALMLAGDRGFWIVAAGVADVQTPGLPSFKSQLAFAPTLAPGPHDLVVRAVDPNGAFGPPSVHTLTATSDGTPAGHLVIALTWDSETDLDLHVVDPTGVEIWKRNINSYEAPPPGEPVDPEAWKKGGVLDADSNAECVIDGRRREDVVWSTVAPSGRYMARVDTFSLCDQTSAHWKVEAFLDGRSLGAAEGASYDVDTEMPHDRGAGVLALEIDVP